jgi:hypothetical protein
MKLVICNTDIDQYAYLTKNNYIESFEQGFYFETPEQLFEIIAQDLDCDQRELLTHIEWDKWIEFKCIP